jgi:hypothetical protein
MSEHDAGAVKKARHQIGRAIVVFAAGALIASFVWWLYSCTGETCAGSATLKSLQLGISLPVVVIAGVLVLLVALSVISVIFSLFQLSDPNQALGLPEGSVRAVIALSLVVLFAILTIFLYSNLADSGKIQSASNLTSAQKDTFIKNLPSAQVLLVKPESPDDDDKFIVFYREIHSQSSEDFAKQLLAIIGTLVTAVASFYFGAQSVSSARDSVAEILTRTTRPPAGPPGVTGINPKTLAAGSPSTVMTVEGNNLENVREAKIVFGDKQILGQRLSVDPSHVRFELTIPQDAPSGAWDVVITDGANRQAKMTGAFTVGPASPASEPSPTNGATPESASVTKITPDRLAPGSSATTITVDGAHLENIAEVKIALGDKSIFGTGINVTPCQITFKLAVPQDTQAGTWDVVLTAKDKKETTAEKAFTIG